MAAGGWPPLRALSPRRRADGAPPIASATVGDVGVPRRRPRSRRDGPTEGGGGRRHTVASTLTAASASGATGARRNTRNRAEKPLGGGGALPPGRPPPTSRDRRDCEVGGGGGHTHRTASAVHRAVAAVSFLHRVRSWLDTVHWKIKREKSSHRRCDRPVQAFSTCITIYTYNTRCDSGAPTVRQPIRGWHHDNHRYPYRHDALAHAHTPQPRSTSRLPLDHPESGIRRIRRHDLVNGAGPRIAPNRPVSRCLRRLYIHLLR